MQERGLAAFERKRLESAACRPILKKMSEDLQQWLERFLPESEGSEQSESAIDKTSSKELKQANRRIVMLEKALQKAEREANRYRERAAVLQSEIDDNHRQMDAFEKHCRESLRTLHVE